MGQSPKSKRLNILAINLDWDELKELENMGHAVAYEQAAWDLILGPNCWRMTPELRRYLPLAIKNARDKKKK